MSRRLIFPLQLIVDHREAAARVLAVIACLLMILSAAAFHLAKPAGIPQPIGLTGGGITFSPGTLRPSTSTGHAGEAALLMVSGGLCLLVALRLSRRASVSLESTERPAAAGRIRWLPVAQGILGLFLLAQANGDWIGLGRLYGVSSAVQVGLLGGGIALLVWGLGGQEEFQRLKDGTGHDTLIVTAITVLALLLRVWKLNDTIHIFVDEMNFATAVRRFWPPLHDPSLLIPIQQYVPFPRLFAYWQTESVALLGRNLVGLRLPSAILGTLAIPAIYWLARALFDRPAALIAAVLLAVFPPQIHFSRLALNNIADPLFGTLAFAFFARGYRSGRRLDYALAGAMLALTQYFYEGGRLFFPPLMLIWIGLGMLTWRPRPSWRGVGIMVITAVIAAFPLYSTLLALHDSPAPRLKSTALGGDYWKTLLVSSPAQPEFQTHLRHIEETFLIYVQQPERSFFYAGHTPLVLAYLVPALLLGLFAALGRWRAPGMQLLILWIGAASFSNSLLGDNMEAPRYVIVFPALALLSAVGICTVWPLIWPGAVRPRLRRAACAALIAVLAAGQVYYYFDRHVAVFNEQFRDVKPYRDGEDALFRSVHFPPGTQIFVISDVIFSQVYANNMIWFLSDDLSVQTGSPRQVSLDYLWGLPRNVDYAFFLKPGDTKTLELLQAAFTLDPPAYTTYPIPPDKQFVLYYAPAVKQ